MKIALNMSTLRGYGSSLIGKQLLRCFANRTDHSFRVWVPTSWAVGGPHKNLDVRQVQPGTLRKLATDQFAFRWSIKDCRVLLSLTDTSIVAAPLPHILMLHQAHLVVPWRELDFLPPGGVARFAAMRAYFRMGMGSVNMFIVQTQFMKSTLHKVWEVPLDRISVIPSGSADVANEGGWSPDPAVPPYILYAAGAAAHKNHRLFSDLLCALRRRGVRVRVKLTVVPDSVPDLAAAAARAGVAADLDYIGHQSQRAVFHLLRGAVAAVIPSRLESYGLSYVEAMRVGTPVIAADLPFAREACGPAAIYCDVNDGWSFGEALCSLLEDPALALSLSSAGRERAGQLAHTWEKVSDAYLEVVEALVGG